MTRLQRGDAGDAGDSRDVRREPDTVTVDFPGGSVQVRRGTILSRALNLDGLRIETPCGGKGRCRKCLVRIVAGEAPPTPHDVQMLWPEEVALGYRLACKLRVESDITVAFEAREIPSSEKRGLSGVDNTHGPLESAPGQTTYGVAVDLGTTTIAAALLQLPDGKQIASGSVPNPQAGFGADVMTRLGHAVGNAADRHRLQEAVLESIAALIRSVAGAAGICVGSISEGVLVGNSVMHHLAFGFDVSGLAEAPYRPSVTEAVTIDFPGLPSLYAPPLIGGFAGSDAVAAALSEGLCGGRNTRLLVDLGTNTEILLFHRGRLFVCSAPAGPAFEGAEISQGMLASVGAVDSVQTEDGALRLGVIGGGKPVGLCGSGLVDAMRVLLETGVVGVDGRLCDRSGWTVDTNSDGNPVAVAIAPGVRITQKDIRAVQLAKGAVRAGIDVLLSTAGAAPEEVDEVLLAGTFGSLVRPESAVAVGLFPKIPASRVKAVGNAALRGAKMLLASQEFRKEAERLARSACHVSLYQAPGFEEVFLNSLEFPH